MALDDKESAEIASTNVLFGCGRHVCQLNMINSSYLVTTCCAVASSHCLSCVRGARVNTNPYHGCVSYTSLPIHIRDPYAVESNLTMFTSNEYEEEYGLFLYNAT